MAETKKFAGRMEAGSGRIISVLAETADEAREKIRAELAKPGRVHIGEAWTARGEFVEEVDDSYLKKFFK